ncbi:MAG: ABC transporter permease [Chloroflexota bacterium]|nr:MAG: ABC transporter permease [Chloroflexota bacterium]
MSAFTNHFLFEFKTGIRNSSAMLMLYMLPLGFYAAMGFIMVEINPGFKELLIPAMIIFAIMSSMILGFPTGLVEARESGIYRSYKINGIPAVSILIIPALSVGFHGLITSAIIAVTAVPFFDAAEPVNWLALVLISLLVVFTFSTLGMLIGVVSSSSRAVVLWSQLIYLPSILLGGMMIPLSLIPEAFQKVSGLLPSTYAMQAYFAYAYQQESIIEPWVSITVLITSGILALALSIFLFNWDSHNDTRRGSPLLGLLILIPYVAAILYSTLS